MSEELRQQFRAQVNQWIVEPARRFCQAHPELCRTGFVTGSFARNTFDLNRPNLNMYFIAHSGQSADLRWRLAEVWNGAEREFINHGWRFAIDCHPYTIAYRDQEKTEQRTFTLTTKVLGGEFLAKRLSLPPTIGLGWLPAYEIIWGESDLPEILNFAVETNDEWFQGLHEALGRYRNLLDHLVWAIPWQTQPKRLAEESLRYAEEAIRDAIPVALTADELREGLQFKLYFRFATTRDFFQERYGQEGVAATGAVEALKQQFINSENFSPEQAIAAWKSALQVWEVVWRKFCERVTTEKPALASWMTRVNAFV